MSYSRFIPVASQRRCLFWGQRTAASLRGSADDIFRFTPLDNQGLGYTVHGVNEAMPIESLEEGVRFFVAMIQQMC